MSQRTDARAVVVNVRMRVAVVYAASSLGVTQTALSLEFTLAGERHVLRAANLAAQTRRKQKSATPELQY